MGREVAASAETLGSGSGGRLSWANSRRKESQLAAEMDASQLFRMVAEHGPNARAELVAEMGTLDARRGQLSQQLAELDRMMDPAKRMTPTAGQLEKADVLGISS